MPSFSTFTNLVTFLAEDCKLEELPHGFTTLMKLRVVDLQGNEIRSLDPKMGRMEGLESLKLGANPMRERRFLTMGVQDLKRELRGRLGVDQEGDEVD
jgi:Leucine-rich repeat (LRR) protein